MPSRVEEFHGPTRVFLVDIRLGIAASSGPPPHEVPQDSSVAV
jgi:hypothetical protein